MAQFRHSDTEIIAAYTRYGSVWKAGDALNLTGQTVWYRLKKAGHARNKRMITAHDRGVIQSYYENTLPALFNLDDLAKALGRTKHLICREARALGLTASDRPHNADTRAKMKIQHKGQWDRNPHPRGMKGKTHTPETLLRVSAASKRTWNTSKTFGIIHCTPEAIERRRLHMSKLRASMPAENCYSRCRSGRREDLGKTFFRSSWEANYARYLNLLLKIGAIEKWDYEPETFWFSDVLRGTNSYKPDFRIKHKGNTILEYIEIKGWITPKDRTKWRRMAKYHPKINLTIVAEKEYRSLAQKWSSAIPQWETDKGGGRKLGLRKPSP